MLPPPQKQPVQCDNPYLGGSLRWSGRGGRKQNQPQHTRIFIRMGRSVRGSESVMVRDAVGGDKKRKLGREIELKIVVVHWWRMEETGSAERMC